MAGIGTPTKQSSSSGGSTITSIVGITSKGQALSVNSFPVVIASDQSSFPVTIAAGSAVIGHVITDSGSVTAATLSAETTKVIGTVNQGTSPWIVAGGGTAGTAATGVVTVQGIANMTKLLVTPDSVALPANQSVNVNQWAGTSLGTPTNFGTTPTAVIAASVNASMFAGTTALTQTGSALDVNLKTSSITLNVSAAQSGTWNVRTQDGSGNALTTNSTTYTSKFALDGNLLGTLGTAFSTAGKVDVKAADGDVFVRSNAASTFPTQATLQTQTDTVMVGGINVKEINGVTPLMGVGASGTGAQRVVLANDAGKTLATVSGTVSSSGDNTIKTAGTNKLKVYAFSLTTTSTTSVTCIFQSGASGTELWRVVLQAPSNVNTGANLAMSPPGYLFATASATLLNLNLSSAQTVHYSVAYFDEA